MSITINSRKLNRAVTFSRPGGGYVYADLNGESGTLGNQICRGGELIGDTISTSGATEAEFERVCRRWWAQYVRREVVGL